MCTTQEVQLCLSTRLEPGEHIRMLRITKTLLLKAHEEFLRNCRHHTSGLSLRGNWKPGRPLGLTENMKGQTLCTQFQKNTLSLAAARVLITGFRVLNSCLRNPCKSAAEKFGGTSEAGTGWACDLTDARLACTCCWLSSTMLGAMGYTLGRRCVRLARARCCIVNAT